MKKIVKIVSFICAIIYLSSCANEEKQQLPIKRALLDVVLTVGGAEEHDLIYQVRYIVFNNASSSPALDFNKIVTVKQSAQESTEFSSMLEVSPNADKMIIALINEPSRLTPLLNNITSPEEFEDITFLMTDMFNANHTTPLSTGISMTGVKRNISVSEANDTEANAVPVRMHVERAVARVELWLKRDASVTAAWEATDTEISLLRSYDSGYLIVGTVVDGTRHMGDATKNFGHDLIVDDWNVDKLTYTGTATIEIGTNERLICAFYTPERILGLVDDESRMRLALKNIHTATGVKGHEGILLKEFTSEESGLSDELFLFERNHIYKIVGTLKETTGIEFHTTVLPWQLAVQNIILDPQCFLKVSRDHLVLPTINSNVAYITAETDYGKNGENRGFPPGLVLNTSDIEYYDSTGNKMTAVNGDKYGWLTVATATAENASSYSMDIQCVVTKVSTNNKGCYAVIKVKAGNLTKKLKISRSL